MRIEAEVVALRQPGRGNVDPGEGAFGVRFKIDQPDRNRTVRRGETLLNVAVGDPPAAVVVERRVPGPGEFSDGPQVGAVVSALKLSA